jgi:hypothetical protein
MDINDYMKLMKKPNYVLISSYVSLVIGGILCFISLFVGYPTFIYTLSIGVVFVLYFVIYTLIRKIRNRPNKIKVKDVKPKKYKIQKAIKIDGDDTKIISICPSCKKKIRLPNKKGLHDVTCPICHTAYKIKIK